MKNNLLVITAAVLVVSITPVFGKRAASSPSPSASAQPNTAASPAGSPARVRPIPFHGMIASVDAKAKTFTINGKKDGGRVFKISDQSAITKGGAPATMKDLVENEEIRGRYWKQADGSLVIERVRVGPPTAEEKAAEQAKKARRAERRAAKAAAASASPSPAASTAPTP